jgi:hypothetical protein
MKGFKMPSYSYGAFKAKLQEPVIQANKIAIIAVCVAVAALVIAMGAYSHGR